MKALRVGLASLAIATVAIAATWLMTNSGPASSRGGFGGREARSRRQADEDRRVARRVEPTTTIPRYSEGFVDDSGYDLARRLTPPIDDRSSLDQVRDAVAARARRGAAGLERELARLPRSGPTDLKLRRHRLTIMVGLLAMHDGDFAGATRWFEAALVEAEDLPPRLRADTEALLGMAALRRGEVENCVACLGPSSCIVPIAPEAVHRQPAGSREAIRRFTSYLRQEPDDLGVRWLLNVAYMTLGEYPEGVPKEFLIPLGPDGESGAKIGRFVNLAPAVGLDTRGPNMYGGSLFDDFTGDDLPDVFVGSHDWDRGASLFVNRGDGHFVDAGDSAGLGGQGLTQNATHADFDNDGRLDVLLLRGAWDEPCRLSLLRNLGEGRFADVTVAAGLAEPIASQAGAWGDYDNDGFVDLYVAGEYHDPNYDSRNVGRLYHNNGDGTFTDVAAEAGVGNERWGKGAAWGDYDDDGRLDLYVSNHKGPNRLYHNDGDGRFTDLAPRLGVTEPIGSFACWFWDFDNDGRLDLYVTGFQATLDEVIADELGKPSKGERPRLYRNLGEGGFRDVTREVGLDRVLLPMGCNYADVDNDGDLDFYLGTGSPPYMTLVPNRMFRNVGGRRFDDVTLASGTGHLQKGHGVSFADGDGDGDLDLFVQLGGTTPGDRAHNVLFQNPGQGHHWLAVKLVGTRTNRAALGAKLRLDLLRPDGSTRSLHRFVTGGSSFGGNSLVVHFGLGEATRVASLTIDWPTSRSRQTFRDVEIDRTVRITEGEDVPRPIAWRSVADMLPRMGRRPR